MNSLLQRISGFIERHTLCESDHRILLAISGGPDSVFLAFALQKLKYEIALVHINYQLRGQESDQEEALVRKYAADWEVPLFVKKLETKSQVGAGKDSLQVVARRIRYDFFEKIMDEEGYHRCALAHQADDQSEQALLSLLTGNAAEVLQKIPAKRGRFIRPLLEISREEILEALQANNLAYAIDSSNLKNDYLRNQVRNIIRPVLRDFNPRADEQLRSKQQLYEKQKAFLDVLLDQWMKSCLLSEEEDSIQQIDWRPFVDSWGKEQLPLLLAHILGKWGLHGHLLWQGVDLLDSQVGKVLWVGENCLRRLRNGLSWGKEAEKPTETIQIKAPEMQHLPKVWNWGNVQLRLSFLLSGKPQLSNRRHFYLDFDKLRFPLSLRAWREGDYMQPLGMAGHKKLSDIFVDEKYTSVQKRQAFVLEDSTKVLLLSDFRIADSVRLTERTERILLVEMI